MEKNDIAEGYLALGYFSALKRVKLIIDNVSPHKVADVIDKLIESAKSEMPAGLWDQAENHLFLENFYEKSKCKAALHHGKETNENKEIQPT